MGDFKPTKIEKYEIELISTHIKIHRTIGFFAKSRFRRKEQNDYFSIEFKQGHVDCALDGQFQPCSFRKSSVSKARISIINIFAFSACHDTDAQKKTFF